MYKLYIPKPATLSKFHITQARTIGDRIIYNSYLDTTVSGTIQRYMRIIILDTRQRTNAVNSALVGWQSR